MAIDTFEIEWIGDHARGFLRTHRTATVVAVFERSLYIESQGEFLCVGVRALGNGPINAIIAGNGRPRGWESPPAVGSVVGIGADAIDAACWRATLTGAQTWRPASWPPLAPLPQIEAALRLIRETACAIGPQEGLAPLVLTNVGWVKRSAPQHSRYAVEAGSRLCLDQAYEPFARIARSRLEKLEQWLSGSARAGAPPTELLGLGPGLTPSGDDALCGMMIALDALALRGKRNALARAVLAEAPRATTPLSGQFLAAAADGVGSEALHDFVAALMRADLAALPTAIDALGRIGHTSGWDALAGAVIAVRACTQQA